MIAKVKKKAKENKKKGFSTFKNLIDSNPLYAAKRLRIKAKIRRIEKTVLKGKEEDREKIVKEIGKIALSLKGKRWAKKELVRLLVILYGLSRAYPEESNPMVSSCYLNTEHMFTPKVAYLARGMQRKLIAYGVMEPTKRFVSKHSKEIFEWSLKMLKSEMKSVWLTGLDLLGENIEKVEMDEEEWKGLLNFLNEIVKVKGGRETVSFKIDKIFSALIKSGYEKEGVDLLKKVATSWRNGGNGLVLQIDRVAEKLVERGYEKDAVEIIKTLAIHWWTCTRKVLAKRMGRVIKLFYEKGLQKEAFELLIILYGLYMDVSEEVKKAAIESWKEVKKAIKEIEEVDEFGEKYINELIRWWINIERPSEADVRIMRIDLIGKIGEEAGDKVKLSEKEKEALMAIVDGKYEYESEVAALASNIVGIAKLLGEAYRRRMAGVIGGLANNNAEDVRRNLASQMWKVAEFFKGRGKFEEMLVLICALKEDEEKSVREAAQASERILIERGIINFELDKWIGENEEKVVIYSLDILGINDLRTINLIWKIMQMKKKASERDREEFMKAFQEMRWANVSPALYLDPSLLVEGLDGNVLSSVLEAMANRFDREGKSFLTNLIRNKEGIIQKVGLGKYLEMVRNLSKGRWHIIEALKGCV